MYAAIVGRWITGELPPEGPETPSTARVPQPIDWPQGEDGTIALSVLDEFNQPVIFDIAGGDSLTLNIAYDLRGGAVQQLAAAPGTDAGTYVFTLTPTTTNDISGPMIYDVKGVKGTSPKLTQQVVPLAYFTILPTASPA